MYWYFIFTLCRCIQVRLIVPFRSMHLALESQGYWLYVIMLLSAPSLLGEKHGKVQQQQEDLTKFSETSQRQQIYRKFSQKSQL